MPVPSWIWWLFGFTLFVVNFIWFIVVLIVHQRSKGKMGGTIRTLDFRGYSVFGKRIEQTGIYAPKGVVASHRGDGYVDIWIQNGIFGKRSDHIQVRDFMYQPGLNLVLLGFDGLMKFVEGSVENHSRDSHRLKQENEALIEENRKLAQSKGEVMQEDIERLKKLSDAAPFIPAKQSGMRRK